MHEIAIIERSEPVDHSTPIQHVLAPIAQDLRSLEQLLWAESAGGSADPFVSAVTRHLSSAGGKRLRPALVFLFGRSGQTVVGHRLRRAAAAVEMIHLGTLYHDDIIDASTQRRGVTSVNAVYGERVAAFGGDYLFSRGWQLFAEFGGAAVDLAAEMIFATCRGEIGELFLTHDVGFHRKEYLENIVGKTAALFELSAGLGAMVGDIPEPQQRRARNYGRSLGLAFQVIDDVLDLAAPASVLGKPPGTDLKAGVYTLPVLLALESPMHGPHLRGLLGRPPTDAAILEIVTLLGEGGWLDAALAEARRELASAIAQLVDLPEPWRGHLTALAQAIATRAELGWARRR